MNKRPVVGVGVVVWKDGKFIMLHRISKHGHNTWSLPGGHLEFGESWEDCAKREVREETGMEITDVETVTITNNVFESEGRHSVTIWLRSDWLSGDNRLTETETFKEQRWCTFDNLPVPLFLDFPPEMRTSNSR